MPGWDPDSSNVEWSSVRGNHGVGNVNEAGRTLFDVLCSKWFNCDEHFV